MILWLAVFSLLLWIGSLILHRFEVIHFGYLTIPLLLAVLLCVISFLGVLFQFVKYREVNWIVVALVFFPLVMVLTTIVSSKKVPRIHDISTDWSAPINFVKIPLERHPMDNSLSIEEKTVQLQKSFYKNIDNLILNAQSKEVFGFLTQLIKSRGWKVVNEDQNNLLIEATAISSLFGFKDDIVIQVIERDSGSLVRARSASRVGKSDLGMNAKRISELFQALQSHFESSHTK